MELWQLDAKTLARMVRNKEVSAREVCTAHLQRIDKVNPKINAIVRRMDDEALTLADRVDRGEFNGPLAGVPATSKINTDHFGHPTDNGMIIAKDTMPPGTNATLHGLMEAGCVFVGRTNAPAMSMRGHTDNLLHGETINPIDSSVSAGGSSGGAGAAVATGMCAIAQGNDIGGSIRSPALFNGIVGLRPSMGRMPTHPTNLSLPRQFGTQIMATNGPMARTVADVRIGLAAMSAPNWQDPNWSPVPLAFEPLPRPIRVALVLNDGHSMHQATRDAVKRAGQHLSDAGYEVEEALPPALDDVFNLWTRVGGAQLRHSTRAMLDAIGDPGLTALITNWISIAPDIDLKGYIDILAERDLIMRAWSGFFDRYPVMVTPTFAKPSMLPDEDIGSGDTFSQLLEAGRYFTAFPPLGVPVLAVPVGEFEGLPQGVQIVARRWRDDLCLDAGEAIQLREGVRAVVEPA